jgi:hypothetical protein
MDTTAATTNDESKAVAADAATAATTTTTAADTNDASTTAAAAAAAESKTDANDASLCVLRASRVPKEISQAQLAAVSYAAVCSCVCVCLPLLCYPLSLFVMMRFYAQLYTSGPLTIGLLKAHLLTLAIANFKS